MNTTPQVAALIASINLSNNGYLVMDYMSHVEREFAIQCAKSGVLKISNGTVHLPAKKPEFFQTPYPTKALKVRHSGPDYEGAILMRQANEGYYD